MGERTKIVLNGEEWLPVPGHDGYFASRDGRILSLKKKEPHILKPLKTKDGHEYVFMYNGGAMRKAWVHRAVLSAVRGTDEHGMLCRHLDDDPSNNDVQNLEWGTHKDNSDDRVRNKGHLRGEKSSSAKVSAAQVMQIRSRYSNGESSRSLAEEFRLCRNAILEIVRGSTWADLPIVPVKVNHSCRRITPVAKDHVSKLVSGGKRYAESRRKPRAMIPCACGCGTMIESPDNKGRDRKFAHGHNSAGKHWKWSKKQA